MNDTPDLIALNCDLLIIGWIPSPNSLPNTDGHFFNGRADLFWTLAPRCTVMARKKCLLQTKKPFQVVLVEMKRRLHIFKNSRNVYIHQEVQIV